MRRAHVSCGWLIVTSLVAGCSGGDPSPSVAEGDGHARMVALLDELERKLPHDNVYLGDDLYEEALAARDGLSDAPLKDRMMVDMQVAEYLLRLGREREAIEILEALFERVTTSGSTFSGRAIAEVGMRLGVAWLRVGEVENCCARNGRDSCILPIRGDGVHTEVEGSTRAIEIFEYIVSICPPDESEPVRARWLANIAYMTLGKWPDQVPAAILISPERLSSGAEFPRFVNVSKEAGVGHFSHCGGAILDDFDGDEWLDVVASSWEESQALRLYRNRRDGTFEDVTERAGLAPIRGGLNVIHADYDNDGDNDLLVLRGGWWWDGGQYPNSLLRNDGTGRFRDVTFEAGLGEVHYPTQTAGWADYDNDGDLDLYIGNESSPGHPAPCQLFRNDGRGRFEDVARAAGVTNDACAKGVTWGDYDGDGFADLYVSNYGERNRLYRNRGDGTFEDRARGSGVVGPIGSFPAWWWDYDNDGVLDLFVGGFSSTVYEYTRSLLGEPSDVGLSTLYRGLGRGAFRDVAGTVGLDTPVPIMGCNFGDLDHDGWLDFYLGTGDPEFETLVPNLMLRSAAGERFVDVTIPGGFGNLQKGHGIAFGDLDNDGDQDVFEQMGGAYRGDAYFDALYENPGRDVGHFLSLKFIGDKSNRSAIGARIRVDFVERGAPRSVFRHVGTGASFGGNPLRQTIGVGDAEEIERVEVHWPTSGETQVLESVPVDRFFSLREGVDELVPLDLRPVELGGK